MIEIAFEIVAALRPAMHRQPCRLVDDQDQAIAIEDAGLDFLRSHGEKALTRPSPRGGRGARQSWAGPPRPADAERVGG